MKNFKNYTILLLIGILFIAGKHAIYALPCDSIGVTLTPITGVCTTTGAIRITFTGANRANLTMTGPNQPVFQITVNGVIIGGSVGDGWQNLPMEGTDPYVRIYTGASAGNYSIDIEAWCMFGTPDVKVWSPARNNIPRTTLTQQYYTFGALIDVNRKSMTCQNTGRIRIVPQNGKATYAVQVTGNPSLPVGYPSDKISFNLSVTSGSTEYIDNIPPLPAGNTLTVTVTDDCGYIRTQTFNSTELTLSSDLPMTSNGSTTNFLRIYAALQNNWDSDCNTAIPYSTASSASEWSYYVSNNFYEYVYFFNGVPSLPWRDLPSNCRPSMTLPSTYNTFCNGSVIISSQIRVKNCPTLTSPIYAHTTNTYLCKSDALDKLKTYIKETVCDSVYLGIELNTLVGICYPVDFQVYNKTDGIMMYSETNIQWPRFVMSNPNSQPGLTSSQTVYTRGKEYEIKVTCADGAVYTKDWAVAGFQASLAKHDVINSPQGSTCASTGPIGTRNIYFYVDMEDRFYPGLSVTYISGPQNLAMGPPSTTVLLGAANRFYPNGASNKIIIPGNYVFKLEAPADICAIGNDTTITFVLGPYLQIDTSAYQIITDKGCPVGIDVSLQGVHVNLINASPPNTPYDNQRWWGISAGPGGALVPRIRLDNPGGIINLPLQGRYTISIYSAQSGGCIMASLPSFDIDFDDDRLHVNPATVQRYICATDIIGDFRLKAERGAPNSLWTSLGDGRGYQYTLVLRDGNPNNPLERIAQNYDGEFIGLAQRGVLYDIYVEDRCDFQKLKVELLDITNSNVVFATDDLGYCEGTYIYLYVLSLGAKREYIWWGPNGYKDTTQFPVIPATKAAEGWYFLKVFLNDCNDWKYDSIYVKIFSHSTIPLTVNTPITVCRSTSTTATINLVTQSGAQAAPDFFLKWYDQSGLPIQPPTAVSIYSNATNGGFQNIFYVSQSNGVCESNRVQVVLNVIANCSIPSGTTATASTSSICMASLNPANLPTLSINGTGSLFGPVLWGGYGQPSTVYIPRTTATNSTGTLVVRFYSDGSGVNSGLNATISCTGSTSFCGTIFRIPTTGSTTVNTCCGFLQNTLDDNYQYFNNSNGYIAITPNILGAKASIEGMAVTEAMWDYYTIYDGVYSLPSNNQTLALEYGYWISNNPGVAIVVDGNKIMPLTAGTVTFSFITGSGIVTTATVTVVGTIEISYLPGLGGLNTFCKTEGTKQMYVNDKLLTSTTGYTVSAVTPSPGLTITTSGANVGLITPATSTANTYSVTYSYILGTCTTTYNLPITILDMPAVILSYGSSQCSSATDSIAPNFTGSTGAYQGGTFSVVSGTGLSLNPSTGKVHPATSTPGTHTVRYTTPAAGVCGSAYKDATVSIIAGTSPTLTYSPALGPTVCRPTSNITYTRTVLPLGGSYSISGPTPSILLTNGGNAGNIQLTSSTLPGIYTVTYTHSTHLCPATYTFEVFAPPTAIPTFSYPTLCSNNTSEVLPTGLGTVPGGTFSTTNSSVSLGLNTVTGAITPNLIPAGTYTNGITYTVLPVPGSPCAAATRSINIIITNATVLTPVVTAGYNPINVCAGTTGIRYGVNAPGGSPTYAWTFPSGWTITAGATTATPTFTASPSAVSGNITVTVSGGNVVCGPVTYTWPVTVHNTPPPKPTIVGTIDTCAPASNVIYSIASPDASATYTWTLLATTGTGTPAGWTPTAVGTGTSRTYTLSATAASARIIVTTTTGCSRNDTLHVAVLQAPATPVISPTIVCQNSTNIFTATSANATSYNWTLPSGWTYISGQGTSTYEVTVGTTNTNLSVAATNKCATTNANPAITITNVPAQPGTPTPINPDNRCEGATQQYQVDAMPAGVTYSWTVTGPDYSTTGGGNTRNINVQFNQAGNYTVTVTPSNTCGVGTPYTWNVTVHATPAAPTTASYAMCFNDNINTLQGKLPALSAGESYIWYQNSSGGTALAGTTLLVNNTTYYVTFTSANGCVSPRGAITVTSQTAGPTFIGPLAFCGTTPVTSVIDTLNKMGTNTGVKLYTTLTGTIQATGNVTAGTIFYASQTVGGCESLERTAVPVTINNIPGAPTGSATQTICYGYTLADLSVTLVAGATVLWYDAATNGNLLSTTTLLVPGTIYYASQVIIATNCESTARLNILVNAAVNAPTGTTPQNFCDAASASNLIARLSGTNIKIYTSSTATTAMSPTDMLSDNITYYASQSNGSGCESFARLAVTVRIYPTPGIPAASTPQNMCFGNTISMLSATPDAGGTIQWYASATTATILVGTTLLMGDSTYYVAQTVNGCQSARTPVFIQSTTVAPSGTSPQNFCDAATASDLISKLTGANMKVYTTETSLTPLSATAALTTGTDYYISQTISGCEGFKRFAVRVNINPLPNKPLHKYVCNITPISTANITVTSPKGDYKYQLNTGAFQKDTVFTNVASGTNYTITVIDTLTGCIKTGDPFTFVCCASAPTLSLSKVDTAICANVPLTISGSFGGSATTVNISVPPGAAKEIPVLRMLTGNNFEIDYTATQYDQGESFTITVTTDNPDVNCVAAEKTIDVLVRALPTVSVVSPSTTTIKIGETINITPNSGGLWASNNTSVATVTSGVVSGLAPGTAILTYTDVHGCQNTLTINVLANKLVIGSIYVVTQPTCGFNTGEIAIDVTGGNGTYEYDLYFNNKKIVFAAPYTNPITGLPAGTYRIVVWDDLEPDNIAESDNIVLYNSNSNLALEVTVTDATSCSLENGTIDVLISGGSGNYNYIWNDGTPVFVPGGSLLHLSPVPKGVHSIQIIDNADGCTVGTGELRINGSGSQLSLNKGNRLNTTCGKSDGEFEFTVTNIFGTAYYQLNNMEIIEIIDNAPITLNGLNAGVHTVRVFDGCGEITDTVIIKNTGANAFSFIATPTNVKVYCDGVIMDGSITLQVTPGVANYKYRYDGTNWSTPTGNTTITIPNLSEGTYYIELEDSDTPECTYEVNNIKIIREYIAPVTITSVFVSSDPTCNTTGKIKVHATGGSGNYLFRVNDTGAFTSYINNEITGLKAGTYFIEVRDANGYPCPIAHSGDIKLHNAVNELAISVTATNSSNCITSMGTGSIKVAVTGATSPTYGVYFNSSYSPLLSTLLTGAGGVINNLGVGDYFVKVADGTCEATSERVHVYLTTPQFSVSHTKTNATCGFKNGTATVTITASNYSYQLDNNTIVSMPAGGNLYLQNLSAGKHTLRVFDGCSEIVETIIIGNGSNGFDFTVEVTPITYCGTVLLNAGNIKITPKPGTAPYQYRIDGGTWLNITGSFLNFPAAEGIYSIEVKDNIDCTYEITRIEVKSKFIHKPLPPTLEGSQIFCEYATVSDLKSNGYASVLWYSSSIDGTPLQTTDLLLNGIYYASQTLNNLCESDIRTPVLVTIDVERKFKPTLESVQDFCTGAKGADIRTDGSTGIIIFGPTGSVVTPATVLIPGNYKAIYRYGSGSNTCEGTDTAYFTVNIGSTHPTVKNVKATQQFCNGATIANIAVPNTGIVWYANMLDAQNDQNRLPAETTLIDNDVIYAVQLSDGACIGSVIPFVVTIKLNSTVDPPYILGPIQFCEDTYLGQVNTLGYGTTWFTSATGNETVKLDSLLKKSSTPYTFYVENQGNTCATTSRAKVDINVETCTNELAIRVFLQGVTKPGSVMTNYLQSPLYPLFIPDLKLPEVNPYGVLGSYSMINSESGPAGQVVDWILVEIWGNFSVTGVLTYYDLLESQALLLQPTGYVVAPDGNKPRFKPYLDGDVRIVVKHRNHLSAMSKEISLDQDLSYDFSASMDMAFKSPYSTLFPMVIQSGTLSLWAGDLNADNYLNNSDVTLYNIQIIEYPYGVYCVGDVTMDGVIDSADASFILYNAKLVAPSAAYYFRKR